MCGVVSGCGAELTIAATQQSMAEPGTSIVLVKRRAVTQMVAISDLNRLLVLCDGLITVHDLETLEKQHSAILEKGVSMFCMDQQGAPLHRMCAVRKKKVLIYEFSLGRFAYMKVGTASWSRRGRAELACKSRHARSSRADAGSPRRALVYGMVWRQSVRGLQAGVQYHRRRRLRGNDSGVDRLPHHTVNQVHAQQGAAVGGGTTAGHLHQPQGAARQPWHCVLVAPTFYCRCVLGAALGQR